MASTSRKRRKSATTPAGPLPPTRPRLGQGVLVVAAALFVVTFAVYQPSLDHQFLSWDDDSYLLTNTRIHQGVTPSMIGWAMTSFDRSNWHPLTWISHALDVTLYGITPGRFDGPESGNHHATSVVIHALNAALLCIVLFRLTRRLWPSAIVAALFALHPLHVESVSWVSERKDVLCMLFMLLALWAYVAWVERGTRWRYALVLVAFAAALGSKPMAVTLPFVLLLLDVWPLDRLSWRAVREKVPLVAMAAGSCVMTFLAQRAGGAMKAGSALSLGERSAHAVYAYVMYLWQMVWPVGLSPFHPLPGRGGPEVAPWMIVAGALGLVAITLLALWQRRRRPYLLVGWLIYLGTLVPVIGLVQVGKQIMADRYTYVPLVGIFIAGVWLAADLCRRYRRALPAVALTVVAILVTLSVVTWRHQAVYADTRALWSRVHQVYPRDPVALCDLAKYYSDRGDTERLVAYYCRSVQVQMPGVPGDVALPPEEVAALVAKAPPGQLFDPVSLQSLGLVLSKRQRDAEAIICYRAALAIDPGHTPSLIGLGVSLKRKGDLQGALMSFQRAARLSPDLPQARYNLGIALAILQRPDEALDEFRRAIALYEAQSWLPVRRMQAIEALASVLIDRGDYDAAIARLEGIVGDRLRRWQPVALLARAYSKKGDLVRAQEYQRQANRLRKESMPRRPSP